MLGNENIKLAIIGNKVDLLTASEQKSPQTNALIQEAVQFSNELLNAKHYLTSAKLNQGIGDLFVSLSKRMIEQSKKQTASRDSRLASSARSRTPWTLSVTDDTVDDQEPRMGANGVPRGRGVDLDSPRGQTRDTTANGGGSCQC